jgi:ketosteroid isomerase-like protein
MAETASDRLQGAYHSFGLGLPLAALALFDQLPGRKKATWSVQEVISTRQMPSRAFATDDLFGLPAAWEVTRVEAERIRQAGASVTVTGRFFCRPKGSWETRVLPFAHTWTLRGGKAVRVVSFLNGIDLRRVEGPGRSAPHGRRPSARTLRS